MPICKSTLKQTQTAQRLAKWVSEYRLSRGGFQLFMRETTVKESPKLSRFLYSALLIKSRLTSKRVHATG